MNTTTNGICLFLGGAIVGSFATAAVMKHLGYHKDGEDATDDNKEQKDATDEDGFDPSKGDTPSFDPKRTVDTHKTRYDTVDKPDPDDLVRKYAEAEHPREESDDEDDGYSDFPTSDINYSEMEQEAVRQVNREVSELEDAEYEEYDEERELQTEIAESMVERWDEVDGFGHVIAPLHTTRKSDIIYLIPEAYLGEIYNVESLVYYERDNMLCDISDVPVEDIPRVVADALEHFGECEGEEETNDDMVYIRNCSLGVEYEITRVDGYYGAKIYGISDEDFEGGGMAQLPRKATKRKNSQQEED